MSYRPSRVAEAFREELMNMIQTDLKDPRIGFVTVTHVNVSRDLRHAVFFLTVMGDSKQKEETLKGLARAKGHIRSELGRRIRLRFLPEIVFELDPSIDASLKVSEILKKLEEEKE